MIPAPRRRASPNEAWAPSTPGASGTAWRPPPRTRGRGRRRRRSSAPSRGSSAMAAESGPVRGREPSRRLGHDTARAPRLRFAAVLKASTATVVAALALVLVGGASPAASFTAQDLTIRMDDGVSIAATLFEPTGAPPNGGWPAVILMHGLGDDRSSMNALAGAMGLVDDQYVVLTFDARGHGASGGLIGIDGQREVKDVGAVYHWLGSRAEVGKIGAFGASYGGGAALDSLVAGIPWDAV